MARRRARIGVNFGDVVEVDFGNPIGSEAGFQRPSVVVIADSFLRFRPSTIFVVPLTPPVTIEVTSQSLPMNAAGRRSRAMRWLNRCER